MKLTNYQLGILLNCPYESPGHIDFRGLPSYKKRQFLQLRDAGLVETNPGDTREYRRTSAGDAAAKSNNHVMDVADLAKELGISKSTVYGWIRKSKVQIRTRTNYRWGTYLVYLDTLPEKYRRMLTGEGDKNGS